MGGGHEVLERASAESLGRREKNRETARTPESVYLELFELEAVQEALWVARDAGVREEVIARCFTGGRDFRSQQSSFFSLP